MKKYFVSNDTTLPLGGAMVPAKKKKKKKSLPTYIEILIGPPNDVHPAPPFMFNSLLACSNFSLYTMLFEFLIVAPNIKPI